MITYLSSLKAGIGPVVANRLCQRFGQDKLWDLIENDQIEELSKVKGVTKRIAENLSQKSKATKTVREILRTFPELTPQLAQKLYEEVGQDACAKIARDPWNTLRNIPGIGFLTIESIARQTPAWNPYDQGRISMGIQQVFRQQELQHMCIPKDELKKRLSTLLCINDDQIIRDSLNDATKRNECIVKGDFAYSKNAFYCEREVAANILRLKRELVSCSDEEIKFQIRLFENQYFTLADTQKTAVLSAFQNAISVITGGPGTGKSTIVQCILAVEDAIDPEAKVMLMAPTGRAAKRMQETTGKAASTIHSALGIRFSDGETGVMEDIEPLDADLIVVDEFSMVNAWIAKFLFSRIGTGTRVVIIGDVDQLPAIGAGNVLKEIIYGTDGMVPVTVLDTIFRVKSDGSHIVTNAQKIRRGDIDLEFDPRTFSIWQHTDESEIFNAACWFYINGIREYGIENTMLLIPHRKKGVCCVNTLNTALEAYLNPVKAGEETIQSLGRTFHAGDRVMQLVNRDDVMNGDIGIIQSISEVPDPNDSKSRAKEIIIRFDNENIAYTQEQMKDIDLAYACSVHKAQGQEYDCVIVVMSQEHHLMAKRNLLYTAITRAKKQVILVGDAAIFQRAILDEDAKPRFTQLGAFVRIMDREIPKDADPRYFRSGRTIATNRNQT